MFEKLELDKNDRQIFNILKRKNSDEKKEKE